MGIIESSGPVIVNCSHCGVPVQMIGNLSSSRDVFCPKPACRDRERWRRAQRRHRERERAMDIEGDLGVGEVEGGEGGEGGERAWPITEPYESLYEQRPPGMEIATFRGTVEGGRILKSGDISINVRIEAGNRQSVDPVLNYDGKLLHFTVHRGRRGLAGEYAEDSDN